MNDNLKYILELYVSGMTPHSLNAVSNIREICESELKDCYSLDIIDIYKNPELATQNEIIFCPSLVKSAPLPRKVLIGNFSDKEKVKKGLGIPEKEI